MGITRESRASESLCLTHRVGITSQGASFHLLSCTDQSSSQRTLPVTLLTAKGNAMTTGCLSGHRPAPHPGARDAAAPGPLCMRWLVTISRAGCPPGWAPRMPSRLGPSAPARLTCSPRVLICGSAFNSRI